MVCVDSLLPVSERDWKIERERERERKRKRKKGGGV